jgi:hypothetical protein
MEQRNLKRTTEFDRKTQACVQSRLTAFQLSALSPRVNPMPITISAGFDKLRSNLEFTGLQSATVSTRQKNARANVAREMTVLDDFLTGSYVRSTMIAPLREADIDVFVVLDAKYWSADGYASCLDKVKRVLSKSYSEATEISRNGQAVTIKFSDFSMDVVPGFYRQGGGFLIPDSRGKRWIPTDPKKHVEIWTIRNKQHNGDLVPLIKMIKAWNRKHSQLFRSFHLETLILKVLEGANISDFPSGVRFVFDKARTAVGSTVADLAGYGDNLGRYLLEKSILDDIKARLDRAYARAREAEQLAAAGKIVDAYDKWRMIFGDYFPAYG